MKRMCWALGALALAPIHAADDDKQTSQAPTLRWEAESLQAMGAESETTYAEGASGGAYVYLPNAVKDPAAPPESSLRVEFQAPQGLFQVRVRALAENGGSDSFFLCIDGESRAVGFAKDSMGQWTWVETLWTSYTPGAHWLVVSPREKSRIDLIEILQAEGGPAMGALAIRQSTPEVPEPNGSRPLDINPPTFRWRGGWERPYSLQLARAGESWDKATEADGIGETFYRPLAPLEPGRWKWRVKTEGGPWRPETSFEVEEQTARWPIGPWEETYARFSRRHPRILLSPEDLPSLREKAAGPLKQNVERWVEQLSRAVGADLSLEEDKGVNEAPDRKAATIRRTASKKDAGAMMSGAGNLALLALALGRDDFAEEAVRRAMAATRLDPKGYTSQSVSDFANGAIVKSVALVYDLLYDRLTPDQRKAMRETLRARVLGIYKPKLEQQVFNAHCWQHVFHDLCCGALAVWDEDPEMAEWLRWAAKMAAALYPWHGGADGGSAEGASYYAGTDMLSSLDAVRFWKRAAGIDLTGNPWFPANPWFLIYSHPLGGPQSSFGDHPPDESPPDSKKAMAALMMADAYGNPYAAAYAQAIAGRMGEDSFLKQGPGNSAFCQPWLLHGPFGRTAPKPLADLPAGRVFRDVGVAYVHSALADPDGNVMFEFRSSPYGSHGHSHADQNSFNIAAYGERLIVDSGHYTSYGDPHHYGWTVTTRAHNALLVDGQGQPSRNLEAYGRIVGFEQGDGWAWVAGEAKTAYREPALERFCRQAVWLRGERAQTYVIFDSIAAADAKPHHYEWLFHSAARPEIDEAAQRALISRERGQARIAWLKPSGLQYSMTNEFDPPAENWRPDKQKIEFPKQWHAAAASREDAPSRQFLTVIQVSRKDESASLLEPALEGETAARIGEDFVKFSDNGVRIVRGNKTVFEGNAAD